MTEATTAINKIYSPRSGPMVLILPTSSASVASTKSRARFSHPDRAEYMGGPQRGSAGGV